MRPKLRAACSLFVALAFSSTALAQCDLWSQDFNAPTSGEVRFLPYWSASPVTAEIGMNPDNGTGAITLVGSSSWVGRTLLPFPQRLTLAFDANFSVDGWFEIGCPNGPPPNNGNARLVVNFDTSGTTAVARFGTDTVPFTPGVPFHFAVDIDPTGMAEVRLDGQVLVQQPWSTLPGFAPCPIALDFRVRHFGGVGTPPTIIDDLCISSSRIGLPYCAVVPNSTGVPGKIWGYGSTSLSTNNFKLWATDLPSGEIGRFLVSRERQFSPVVTGSVGNLCVGGVAYGAGFFPIQLISSAGTGAATVNWASLPPGGGPPLVGQPMFFQYYFRDNPGSNFSNGLGIILTP